MPQEKPSKVIVHLFGFLRDAARRKKLTVLGCGTLFEVLVAMRMQYPSLDAKMDTAAYVILVNGVNMIGQDIKQVRVCDGDEITLVPFAAGG